jgi:hypothetical protein
MSAAVSHQNKVPLSNSGPSGKNVVVEVLEPVELLVQKILAAPCQKQIRLRLVEGEGTKLMMVIMVFSFGFGPAG